MGYHAMKGRRRRRCGKAGRETRNKEEVKTKLRKNGDETWKVGIDGIMQMMNWS